MTNHNWEFCYWYDYTRYYLYTFKSVFKTLKTTRFQYQTVQTVPCKSRVWQHRSMALYWAVTLRGLVGRGVAWQRAAILNAMKPCATSSPGPSPLFQIQNGGSQSISEGSWLKSGWISGFSETLVWCGVLILAGSETWFWSIHLSHNHFQGAASLHFKPRPGAKPFIWKWAFFHMQIKLIPYEWFCTWPRFRKEAKSNSGMGYLKSWKSLANEVGPWR